MHQCSSCALNSRGGGPRLPPEAQAALARRVACKKSTLREMEAFIAIYVTKRRISEKDEGLQS